MAFDKFRARSEIVKQRINDNKVFAVIAVIIVLFLVFQAMTSQPYPDNVQQQESSTAESDAQRELPEEPHWRFYWSDLVILGGGSAFCGIMIAKERRKARESL